MISRRTRSVRFSTLFFHITSELHNHPDRARRSRAAYGGVGRPTRVSAGRRPDVSPERSDGPRDGRSEAEHGPYDLIKITYVKTKIIIYCVVPIKYMDGDHSEDYRKQSDLRTYRRRSVTRSSGYHVIDGFTGGECIIHYSEKVHLSSGVHTFEFVINDIFSPALFTKNVHIIAFGGFLYSPTPISMSTSLNVCSKPPLVKDEMIVEPQLFQDWRSVGIRYEFISEGDIVVDKAIAKLTISTTEETDVEFISFDFDAITYDDYVENDFSKSFHQKTNLSEPTLYYFETTNSIKDHLVSQYAIENGRPIIMKSCNRCGRYIPINIDNETNTLGFVLHCKKRAPCKHSTFMSYSIQNINDLDPIILNEFNIENGKIKSYCGHQLECKACKKFYVNAPLNPLRDAQQHREDSLRRRAIESLVDRLLKCNTIHLEFERKTGNKFTYYIYNKFDHKCFKCGRNLTIDEMNLDHTMPLAYLYRLDESATCLCASCNSQKSDFFPVDFYTEDELTKLSSITGLSFELLHSKSINEKVLQLLIDNVVWYFDDFLTQRDYAKVRGGILTADKINDSIKRVAANRVDLVKKYHQITGHYPSSITIR